MVVFVLRPSVRVPYFSLYSGLSNPPCPLCYLRIFTKTAMKMSRTIATTIDITEEKICPVPSLNFIYRKVKPELINTPNALMPAAFIMGGPYCKMKRNTAFQRSFFESQLENRDMLKK
jgi:hypothetical protein